MTTTTKRIVKRYGAVIAYVLLALACAYSVWQVSNLANRIDQDAKARIEQTRTDQRAGCDRTNALRSSLRPLTIVFPTVFDAEGFKRIDCAKAYSKSESK